LILIVVSSDYLIEHLLSERRSTAWWGVPHDDDAIVAG
jgi:hypothetical protein